MLYSRYKTEEIKDKKGKVVGHKRVRLDDKKIKEQDEPKGENRASNRKSRSEQLEERKASQKKKAPSKKKSEEKAE